MIQLIFKEKYSHRDRNSNLGSLTSYARVPTSNLSARFRLQFLSFLDSSVNMLTEIDIYQYNNLTWGSNSIAN